MCDALQFPKEDLASAVRVVNSPNYKDDCSCVFVLISGFPEIFRKSCFCATTTSITTKIAHNVTHERHNLYKKMHKPSTWYTQLMMTVKDSKEAVIV